MKYVSKPIRKTDAMALVTGKPVFTNDLAPKDCLIVKVLRSPHAHAEILEIKKYFPVRLVACVPCADQAKKFSAYWRNVYNMILPRADEKIVLR